MRCSAAVFTTLLCLMPAFANASRLDTLQVFSMSMQKSVPCLVIVPDRYTVQGEPYSVLYLLHGWSGHFGGWLRDAPQLQAHADAYNILIVCPDGGYDSWYFDSPVDSTVRYETHVAKEVPAYIDYYYHTKKDRKGRAIAGLSMGGHGALWLAGRHPEMFGAAGSMCGGLDLRPFRKNDWDLQGVLGNPIANWANWESHSVVNTIPWLKEAGLALIVDCGLNDFFLDVNRSMHRALMDANIPHEYTERPGEHNRAYWGNAVDYQILFFDKFFKR